MTEIGDNGTTSYYSWETCQKSVGAIGPTRTSPKMQGLNEYNLNFFTCLENHPTDIHFLLGVQSTLGGMFAPRVPGALPLH